MKRRTSSGAFGTAGSGKTYEYYGINILTPPEKEPLWKQFLRNFQTPSSNLLVALLLSVGVAFYQFFTGTEPASVFRQPAGILAAIGLPPAWGSPSR